MHNCGEGTEEEGQSDTGLLRSPLEREGRREKTTGHPVTDTEAVSSSAGIIALVRICLSETAVPKITTQTFTAA